VISSLLSSITKGRVLVFAGHQCSWISFSFHYRKQKCRHVFSFELENKNAALDTTTAFFMELPTSDVFQK